MSSIPRGLPARRWLALVLGAELVLGGVREWNHRLVVRAFESGEPILGAPVFSAPWWSTIITYVDALVLLLLTVAAALVAHEAPTRRRGMALAGATLIGLWCAWSWFSVGAELLELHGALWALSDLAVMRWLPLLFTGALLAGLGLVVVGHSGVAGRARLSAAALIVFAVAATLYVAQWIAAGLGVAMGPTLLLASYVVYTLLTRVGLIVALWPAGPAGPEVAHGTGASEADAADELAEPADPFARLRLAIGLNVGLGVGLQLVTKATPGVEAVTWVAQVVSAGVLVLMLSGIFGLTRLPAPAQRPQWLTASWWCFALSGFFGLITSAAAVRVQQLSGRGLESYSSLRDVSELLAVVTVASLVLGCAGTLSMIESLRATAFAFHDFDADEQLSRARTCILLVLGIGAAAVAVVRADKYLLLLSGFSLGLALLFLVLAIVILVALLGALRRLSVSVTGAGGELPS